jgi:hypothetical protein
MFGQTDPQHGLLDGYDQFHDLQTIRQKIQPGSRVEIFLEGRWKPAVVKRKGYKWVDVESGRQKYTLHAGLIRFPKA